MKEYLLKNKKKIIAFSGALLFIFVFLFFPNLTFASGEAVGKVLGWIMYPFIWLMGKLAILLLKLLVGVAQYNDFIHSPAVTYGWTIVRDLSNMFFVLILLIIAFATILRVDSYNLKTWLPKLVIMAVLINFSKLICGIFIDFSQVIMLTFVNAVRNIAGGNLTDMLGISKILTANESAAEVTFTSILGTMVLALVMSIIAVVVILTMLIMLVMRIVMIWIYVVLSPLAYLLASFPQGQSYSQRWWSDFSKNLIVGPLIAFFLWLSFASLGGVENSKSLKGMNIDDSANIGESGETVGFSEAGSADHMIKFIVSIGMLLGGMMLAQEMGGMAGKVAGKGMAKLQSMGSGALKMGKRVTGIQRAQDAAKAYRAQKDTKRQERAQRDAGGLAAAAGRVKKGTSKVLGHPVNAINRAVGRKRNRELGEMQEGIDASKKTLAQQEGNLDKAKEKKVKLQELQGKIHLINEGQNKIDQVKQDRDDIIADAQKHLNNNTMSQADFDAFKLKTEQDATSDIDNINKENTDLMKSFNELTGGNIDSLDQLNVQEISRSLGDTDLDISRIQSDIDSLGHSIEDAGEAMAEKMRKNKVFDQVASVLGNVATLGAYGKLKYAGEADLEIASNIRSSSISKDKDRFKDLSDNDLKTKMNDYQKFNESERTAATMLLMERGGLSEEEAKIKTDEIRGSYKNDNKVLNQLDSSLLGSYQHLSKNFVDLKQTANPPAGGETNEERKEREARHEKTKDKIVKGIVNGSIKLEAINDQESLNLVIPKLAETLTPGNFTSIYDRQSKPQRSKIKKSLDVNASQDSNVRVTLANINSSLNSLDGVAEKEDYLSKANLGQLDKLVSSVEGLESIRKFFEESGRLNNFRALAQSKNLEGFKKEMNGILQKTQLNLSTPAHRGVLDGIMNHIAKSK